ncbi:hypothetical protein Pelo_19445 [Pelomyxa schiedti]|nr:hypothetical protein Pelo_19445 [Pelomyxa schiedti]
MKSRVAGYSSFSELVAAYLLFEKWEDSTGQVPSRGCDAKFCSARQGWLRKECAGVKLYLEIWTIVGGNSIGRWVVIDLMYPPNAGQR